MKDTGKGYVDAPATVSAWNKFQTIKKYEREEEKIIDDLRKVRLVLKTLRRNIWKP